MPTGTHNRVRTVVTLGLVVEAPQISIHFQSKVRRYIQVK
jgi:hypothetical protein